MEQEKEIKLIHIKVIRKPEAEIQYMRNVATTNQPLKNVRIIKLTNGKHKASFIVPKDVANGHIEIVSVGENGKSNKLVIRCEINSSL